MKTQTILIAGGAAVGALALAALAKRPAKTGAAASVTPGVSQWYMADSSQQTTVERAVAAAHREMFSVLDKTDPNFWA